MWDYKDPSETITVAFEYANELGGANISPDPVVTVSVVQGTDPNPGDLLDGFVPTVVGSQVLHQVKAGLSGVKYYFECLATLSDGRKLLRWDILPVLDQSESQ